MTKAKYMLLDTNEKIMQQLKINKWHKLEKKNGTGFNSDRMRYDKSKKDLNI